LGRCTGALERCSQFSQRNAPGPRCVRRPFDARKNGRDIDPHLAARSCAFRNNKVVIGRELASLDALDRFEIGTMRSEDLVVRSEDYWWTTR
jgi:hypothetical protein